MRAGFPNPSLRRHRSVLGCAAGALCLLSGGGAVAADLESGQKAAASYVPSSAFDWTGFYAGGHLGYAWGNSNWTGAVPGGTIAAGSLSLAQPVDTFKESGSFVEGLQAGYNYMLPGRFVIGAEADVTFPAYPDPANGLGTGGTSPLLSGAESYGENVLSSGTLRGRIGYAPGNWLLYATGGFAWNYDQFTLTQTANGASESQNAWRFGWAAGAGAEVPVAPHWTARLEYLFKDYGFSGVTFPAAAQRFNSDLAQQEVRFGLNYQFGGDAPASAKNPATAPASDNISLHGQATFTWQGYGPIRSPYEGANSLPGGGEGRETADITLYAGVRPWKGAEFWVNPEIDQGFGVGNTHGTAGYVSGEAYKLGDEYPYARVQRYFLRQTMELGGEAQKVDEDINVFAGSTTKDRLVLTAGKFGIADIFDTNKYANNPKTDFLNWSLINTGTFDYAGDGWGYNYGAAAEWYQGRFTLRGGVFDLSQTSPGGVSPFGSVLDPTFHNFELAGEIEERHELWGQPGKLKLTGFLERGDMGSFADAIAYIDSHPAADPASSINMVRKYQSRPGVSFNLEQQVREDIGGFARAGWSDGTREPWDFTDIDRTASAGVSVTGKQWGRPGDTVGIAGVVNGITGIHAAFLNAGGLGVLVGDGKLPDPGWEKIIEAYYSYALPGSTKVSFDYQFVENPAYNADRGPANVFAGRVHWQF